MPDIPQLDYAPREPMHRRRVFRRWIYAIVLLGVLASAWDWGPLAWRRVQLLYWQHRCLVYTSPPDQLVYDSSHRTQRTPPEWSKFYSIFSPPGFNAQATLFLHQMKKPNGENRLVVVDLETYDFSPDFAPYVGVEARVFIPGSLLGQPQEAAKHFPLAADTLGARIFAGTIDLSDPTHFTVRILEPRRESFYDGWLQNDDTLVFSKRTPATTRN